MKTWQDNFSKYLSIRDRFDLKKRDLLADYAEISKRRPNAAFATAIRNQSLEYLDILAMEASGNRLVWDELRALAAYTYSSAGVRGLEDRLFGKGRSDTYSAKPIEDIARLILLSGADERDRRVGAWLLSAVNRARPADRKNKKARLLEVQYSLLEGEKDHAADLLAKWKDIRLHEYSYLEAELISPFGTNSSQSVSDLEVDEWLRSFNKVFFENELWPVGLERTVNLVPFDALTVRRDEADMVKAKGSGVPVVSVVMTAYKPESRQILTSARSILQQTLKQIELIIVDDASGDDYQDVFDELQALDPRVRVIQLEQNSGTYAARNVGLFEANGEFYTGQDDDDWSHPQRLEHQVRFMRENPTAIGCRVDALLCNEELSRLRLGYKSINSNASSLMVRTADLKKIGGFLETRKAADTEVAKRIEKRFQKKVQPIRLPLTIVRILADSLSRSEFAAGWSHPARNQFKSSYEHWHANSQPHDLDVVQGVLPEVAVPRRFRVLNSGQKSYQVVLAGDWRKWGGPQKSMLEEIHALKSAGMTVAVLHLEAGRFMSTKVDFLAPQIQGLINSGYVDEVLFDDAIDIDLLILRYPPILQFMADQPTALRIKRMFITANQAPSELDGSDIRYLVRDCHEKAQVCFTRSVTWVPQGPQVREAIEVYLAKHELEPFDFPGILALNEWHTSIPRQKRGNRPVIGRHSRDNEMKWPESKELIGLAYPLSSDIQVRVMGGGKAPSRLLKTQDFPDNWTVLERDAMGVYDFLDSLDFYVFFQNSQAVEAFGRSILEAIAANLVVILPRQFQQVFGRAAVYCEAADVEGLVRKYYEDWDLYAEQQRVAAQVLKERFSREAFSSQITQILASL